MTEKGHGLTIGQTMSGKTILNQRLSRGFRRAGINTIILDPHGDPAWDATLMFRHFDEFFAYVSNPEKCLQCALFIDESGISLDKYSKECDWLTVTARHFGHRTHIIANRAEIVSRNMRSQCETLYTFQVCATDARQYANDFNCPLLAEVGPTLRQGEFLKITRYQPVARLRLW